MVKKFALPDQSIRTAAESDWKPGLHRCVQATPPRRSRGLLVIGSFPLRTHTCDLRANCHFDSFITMKLTQAVIALSALAQDSRLSVFRLLVKTGPKGLPAGTVAEQLNIPPATLSFHLKELSHAGLIDSRRKGRFVIYAPSIKGISCLMGFLLEDCCQGQPELCAPGLCGDTGKTCKTNSKKTKRKRKETPA